MSRTTPRPAGRAAALAGAVAVVGVPLVLLAAPAQAAVPYDHAVTGGGVNLATADQAAVDSFTVPTGVCSIDWTLRGGSGGVGPGNAYGGLGTVLTGTTPTTAGTAYTVYAGGAGTDTNNGGRGGQSFGSMVGGNGYTGGGGASMITNTTTSATVAVAAGGGGGGQGNPGGIGGSAAAAGVGAAGHAGGAAGTSSAAGPGGAGTSANGSAGSGETGGAGAGVSGTAIGGGGGGGVHGGGGGGAVSGGSTAGGGGGGGWSGVGAGFTDATPVNVASVPLGGFYSAIFGLCPAPVAPTALTATATGQTAASVTFTPGAGTGMPVSGWQVSTDAGATWAPLATTGSSSLTGQLTGLSASTTYGIRVRPSYTVPTTYTTTGASTAGTTAYGAVGSTSVTTLSPGPVAPGPVTGVVATAGVASVAVSWSAPTSGGPVSSYTVTASPGQATCTTTTTTCVLGGVAGTAYTVSVVANGAGGTATTAGTATSGPVTAPPVPTSVPTGIPTTLTTTDGQIDKAEPGQDITVVGSGFAPFSEATVVIYSTPTVLGTVTTDGNGSFRKAVRVPASLAAGQHTLVASGTDPSGNQRFLALPVTVAPSPGGTSSGGAVLASTGFSAGTPLGLGALALLSGAALVVLGRRRRS